MASLAEKSLVPALRSLPEPIKDWLGSEELAAAIGRFNRPDSIIPWLILRLVVQDLAPRNFVNELSQWLEINEEEARVLAQKIKDELLAPVAHELKKIGVDVSLIRYAAAPPVKIPVPTVSMPLEKLQIPPAKPPAPMSPIKIAPPPLPAETLTKEKSLPPPPKIQPAAPPPLPVRPPPPPTEPLVKSKAPPTPPATPPPPPPPPPKSRPPPSPSTNLEPFILHEEPLSGEALAAEKASRNKPTFSYQTPLSARSTPPPGAPTVKIERVVHYSQFYTPIRKMGKKPSLKVPKSRWFV